MDNPERRRPEAEPVPLSILYEDEAILVLDKPPGIVVHPTYKNGSGTLLNGVLWHVRERTDASPGILTRLDKDTSGVVIIGLTAVIHAAMQRDGTAGRITKQYLALVHGHPEPAEGSITSPLGRDTVDRRVVVVRQDGQQCETRYDVITALPDARALVRCVPITGRTHQIRVHLASSGWPIVGDRAYGSPDPAIARQALHAWRVRFRHPQTLEPMTIAAPVPNDMRALLPDDALQRADLE